MSNFYPLLFTKSLIIKCHPPHFAAINDIVIPSDEQRRIILFFHIKTGQPLDKFWRNKAAVEVLKIHGYAQNFGISLASRLWLIVSYGNLK